MSRYYILYTFPGQPTSRVQVMHGEDKVIVAEEGNQQLLVDMATKLQADNLIGTFRLVKEVV